MSRNGYDGLSWSSEDIEQQTWKAALGGGAEKWESRGQFQTALMKHLGLQPNHMFADFGCGPLRAGQYLIEYLDAGRYHGFDFNDDFLAIGRSLVETTPSLAAKSPEIVSSSEHDLTPANYDVILAFSVLNHFQSKDERKAFLDRLKNMKAGAKAYITHARWMTREADFHNVALTHRLLDQNDLPDSLNLVNWGWKNEREIFPILEVSA